MSWTQNCPKAVNMELKIAGLEPKLNNWVEINLADGNCNPLEATLGMKNPEINKTGAV
jgi:hypothetical protein